MNPAPRLPVAWLAALAAAVLASWCVGMFDRGYWTPDEPREADIAWRMSWQPDKAVPLLAGEPFCEKPPLAYWVAGAVMSVLGPQGWAARLPNLIYAMLTALAVGLLGRRSVGPLAGVVAAAMIGTLLLSYQVSIWLATDAPLLAAVALALLGLQVGYHAGSRSARLIGYSGMHAALAAGFLSKSAAAWMVPVLCLLTLVAWDRRWRELLRWELYAGLALQAVVILTWVGFVYAGPDGLEHLKVFFWNNLAGRFAQVDAPDALQYAAAHRNSPGKYLLELPVYLWPWTLLVIAAARRAWLARAAAHPARGAVRFAVAAFVPTLAVLSLAATARNIYLAPALPGLALLVGWWVQQLPGTADAWDLCALRGTGVLLIAAALVLAAVAAVLGLDAGDPARVRFVLVSAAGLLGAVSGVRSAWRHAGRAAWPRATAALVLAYAALLVGPASQIYGRVDAWQDLASIGRSMQHDAGGRPLILFAPDETTRAFIDMYARPTVELVPGPITARSLERLRQLVAAQPSSLVVSQLPGRRASPALERLAMRLRLAGRLEAAPDGPDPAPAWAAAAGLTPWRRYALPNGRRYALLAAPAASAPR